MPVLTRKPYRKFYGRRLVYIGHAQRGGHWTRYANGGEVLPPPERGDFVILPLLDYSAWATTLDAVRMLPKGRKPIILRRDGRGLRVMTREELTHFALLARQLSAHRYPPTYARESAALRQIHGNTPDSFAHHPLASSWFRRLARQLGFEQYES